MLNAYFNLYTDKTGKNRPKVENFKKFLRQFYKNGLNKEYSMARMPWLMTQGNPTVTKGFSNRYRIPNIPQYRIAIWSRGTVRCQIHERLEKAYTSD